MIGELYDNAELYDTVELVGSLILNPLSVTINDLALNPDLLTYSMLSLQPLLSVSYETSNNPKLVFGPRQVIGNVTVHFASELYTVKFKE